ncbi:MAG: hypothetical protein PVI40_02215 [Chlamydiota bacterium]|jgi:hypothetical protein
MTLGKPNKLPERDLKNLENKQGKLDSACKRLSSDLHASQPNVRQIQKDCDNVHKCADDLERAVKDSCKKCGG